MYIHVPGLTHVLTYLPHFAGGIAVRLINGSNSFEGRVEVKVTGEWKSVCDTNWDKNDAKTVCTMLGLP